MPTSPTVSEICAPYSSRDNTSRPNESLPNRKMRPGASTPNRCTFDGMNSHQLVWVAAHEELHRQLARSVLFVREAAHVGDAHVAHVRPQAEAAVGAHPVQPLWRVEVLSAVHLFLRIGRDEGREQRQQVEDRQHDAARDRQRALAHLRPEDDAPATAARPPRESSGSPLTATGSRRRDLSHS